MQQKIAQEKTKTDIVFDIIKNESVDGKISLISFEKIATMHGVAPNWRKFYLKSLSAQGKIRCDGLNIHILRKIKNAISEPTSVTGVGVPTSDAGVGRFFTKNP